MPVTARMISSHYDNDRGASVHFTPEFIQLVIRAINRVNEHRPGTFRPIHPPWPLPEDPGTVLWERVATPADRAIVNQEAWPLLALPEEAREWLSSVKENVEERGRIHGLQAPVRHGTEDPELWLFRPILFALLSFVVIFVLWMLDYLSNQMAGLACGVSLILFFMIALTGHMVLQNRAAAFIASKQAALAPVRQRFESLKASAPAEFRDMGTGECIQLDYTLT